MNEHEQGGRRPGPAAIRRALAECMTLDDVAAAMGWSRATAAKYRERGPANHGLPEPDAVVGRSPVWFRVTFERWQASRPGRGAGGGRPRGYRPARRPAASFTGSGPNGGPHCERCRQVGHVAAHPELGCGDVGCTAAHGPDDELPASPAAGQDAARD